jgi:hypothetical protein
MTDYRIRFTIERSSEGDEDYADIGFGSSGGYDDVAAALYEVDSIVQNWQWETEAGMPDPLDIKAERDGEDGT